MEAIISGLLNRFERGALSRRDLVQGLTVLAAANAVPGTALAEDAGIKLVRLDHVGIQVTDVAKTTAFYQNAFGFATSVDPKTGVGRVAIGKKNVISVHNKKPTGVDHIAVAVENFNKDAVTQALKARGVTPVENEAAGFHVVDPDGISVQIVGGAG